MKSGSYFKVAFPPASSMLFFIFSASSLSSVDPLILIFTVIAGSCLSLYPSLISLFASDVAQLGQYPSILNPLYTKFWLY